MCEDVTLLVKGISKAADDLLGVSTSYVSSDIKRLEERLNTRLLSRSTRTVRLTDMGRTYYERARDIHNKIEALESEMRIYRNC
jgi:DNA-binding transcriptional LysR family regulator